MYFSVTVKTLSVNFEECENVADDRSDWRTLIWGRCNNFENNRIEHSKRKKKCVLKKVKIESDPKLLGSKNSYCICSKVTFSATGIASQ